MTEVTAPPGDAEFLATFDVQSEDFVDLVLSDPTGIYIRTRGAWAPVQPTDLSLDGREVIEVNEKAVDLFDGSEDRGFDRKTALKYAADDGGDQ